MVNILLIIQFSICFLILCAVLIQKSSKDSMELIQGKDTESTGSSFIVKATAVLIFLFFINSIILGNIFTKKSILSNDKIEKDKDIK